MILWIFSILYFYAYTEIYIRSTVLRHGCILNGEPQTDTRAERAVWPAAVLAEPPAELTVAAHAEVDVPLRLLVPQLLLKLQGVGLLP